MAKTGGDILVETLIKWGVDTIFGIPGDGINGVFEALRTRQDQIQFVQVRHEEVAAFAACAYAKFTGKLGVCLATSGPGGIHLLNGIYDAKLDNQPVLAITGAQHHDLIETFTQQDVALDKLFMDATAYSVRVMGPAHVEDVVEQACRTAIAYRQPTHVMIPVDFQSQPVEGPLGTQRRRPRLERHGAAAATCPIRRCWSAPPTSSTMRRSRSFSPAAGDRRDGESCSPPPNGCRRRSASRCSARQPFPTTAPSPPAASACSGPSRRRKRWRLRHAADRRVDLPLHRILSEAGHRRKRSRSNSIPSASGFAIPSTSAWSATASACCPNCFRCCARTTAASSSKARRRACSDWRELMEERGTRAGHAR